MEAAPPARNEHREHQPGLGPTLPSPPFPKFRPNFGVLFKQIKEHKRTRPMAEHHEHHAHPPAPRPQQPLCVCVCQEKLRVPLAETHEVLSITACPQMLGWPVRRTRVFSAGVNRSSMVWLGPTDPDELQRHFESFFKCTMNVTADCFLVASDSEIHAEQRRLAKLRGHCVSADSSAVLMPKHQVYAPGQLLRFQGYDEKRPTGSSTWFADLEQAPGRGASTPGVIIPSMLTHGPYMHGPLTGS